MNKEELLNNKDFYKFFKNGEDQIQMSLDRQSSFEPALVPKRHNIIEGLEKIIIFFLNQRDERERYRDATTDNLNGFTQTIRSVFHESQTQICVVHQIRNAYRYVVWKDQKPLLKTLNSFIPQPAGLKFKPAGFD